MTTEFGMLFVIWLATIGAFRTLDRIPPFLLREGNDVYYTTKPNGNERVCWITTWIEWCRKADFVSQR